MWCKLGAISLAESRRRRALILSSPIALLCFHVSNRYRLEDKCTCLRSSITLIGYNPSEGFDKFPTDAGKVIV